MVLVPFCPRVAGTDELFVSPVLLDGLDYVRFEHLLARNTFVGKLVYVTVDNVRLEKAETGEVHFQLWVRLSV